MYDFKPKKYLGQNFLKDPKIVEKIIRYAKLKPTDVVVEVGPGFGILTKALAKKVKLVIAVEIDEKLIPILKANLKGLRNIEILKMDALRYLPPETPYKWVANVPYAISSPLLNHFIKDQFLSKNPRPPVSSTLMLQKEVAQKLCKKPPRMNVLALHVQPFGEPKYLFMVKKGSFSPVPRVDSAVVHINIFEKPKISGLDNFLKLVHSGFSQKRKQLWNSLAAAIPEIEKRRIVFQMSKINPERRAETLSISEWKRLTKSFETTPQLSLF